MRAYVAAFASAALVLSPRMSASAGKRGLASSASDPPVPRRKGSSAAVSSRPPSAKSPKKPKPSTDEADKAWFDFFVGVNEEYRRYMREEWGVEKRGDQPLFEKLCLEGAQAGLSWATILKKRAAYRRDFKDFDIEYCAGMTEAEIEPLLGDSRSGADCIVRHKGKVLSVVNNAKAVLALQREAAACGSPPPPHGYFDQFLWEFVGGPTICYSFMQSCGLIVDHPAGTPEYEAARERLAARVPPSP
ncbi:hypothetical protein AB1Y20_019938 [Prymnesium parvum]|uniref:DNA-3-methyladenine glycosylase I n=1 Tax=Prymnesium parvum TaxID=97485 RepID=A0AB34JTS1_PRYPA